MFLSVLNGDYLNGNAIIKLAIEDDFKRKQEMWLMKIPHGNRAPVVVRVRESLIHGEGEQFIGLNTKLERSERLYEKSENSISQSS